MKDFIVNGRKEDSGWVGASGAPSIQNLGEYVQQIYRKYSNEHELVASVLVDGIELTDANEKQLAGLNLQQINSIEVLTSTPQQVASETLTVLMDFMDHLIRLSQSLSQEIGNADFHARFNGLANGLETTVQTFATVKTVSRAGLDQSINLLEADLHSILKDLLAFYEQKQNDFLRDLLANHLPTNLQEWKDQGIPALIKAQAKTTP
ncbi:MAG: hypothetical protein AB7P04_05865 [Bacteriovoracia bacterium]